MYKRYQHDISLGFPNIHGFVEIPFQGSSAKKSTDTCKMKCFLLCKKKNSFEHYLKIKVYVIPLNKGNRNYINLHYREKLECFMNDAAKQSS